MAEPVRFQHYEVLRRDDGSLFELGRGAMGITYKAFDTNLRTNVALKVINATYLNSEVARQRFLREARAAAAIRHPNVATVFHLGNEDDSYFYAMEFIDGETVEAYMQREGAVATLMALEVAAQVARALAAAEKQGLVHRDIKPSNLMLVREAGDDEFTVKVIDFGLAKAAEKDAGDTATLTQGGFLGTPHFASPEQLEETELDSRSDIYSLGITLYYMLAGRTPFSGSLAQVMSQHLHREPPLELLADQPRQVIALLERMMAKDPANRPQTPTELRREIEACVEAVSHAHSGTIGGAPTEAAEADTITDAPREPSALEPAPGVKLAGRLELLDAYQPGEFGKTFRAKDLETGKIVAVLILDPNLLPTSEAYTRLENEVTAVQAVKHPAVIRVYSLERAHHFSFVTREWIEGLSLLDAMRKRGTMSAGDALEILTSLAGGLEAVQKTGVPCPALSAHWITLVKDVESGATLPKFNALNFAGVASLNPDATLVAIPLSERSSSAVGEYVTTLAGLAYQMFGGMSAPGGTFIPIPGLSEDANLVLRRALKGGADFTTPVAFVAALEDAIGEAPEAQAKPPRLPTVVPSAAKKRSPLPLIIAGTLLVMIAVLAGAILLVLPRLQMALHAGQQAAATPSPTPVVVEATPTPVPTPAPTPTPDPRVVALNDAIKRVQDKAMSNDYVGALNLLDDLGRTNPEASQRIKDETEKTLAKLGSETNNSVLEPDRLKQLNDLLEAAAERGSVSAQMLLGMSYKTSDPTNSFKYLFLAATEGKNSEAMFQIGNLYANGHGVQKDLFEAVKWFEKAGLLHPMAVYSLGECYYFGKGVPRSEPDFKRAFQYLQLAANQYGNTRAQVLLGDMYHNGDLGKPNYVEAARLWKAAVDQNSDDARTKLIYMQFAGEMINGIPLKEANLEKADQKSAFEQFKAEAERGNVSSMFYYARCLLGVMPDVANPKLGQEVLMKAAALGHLGAQDLCRQYKWDYTKPTP
jgi:serine/threonine protein kinase/TPR repeat protein